MTKRIKGKLPIRYGRERERERERSIGEDGEDGEDARVHHKLKDQFVSSQPTLEDRAWIRRGREVEEGDEHGLLLTIEGFGGLARTQLSASLSIWPLLASTLQPPSNCRFLSPSPRVEFKRRRFRLVHRSRDQNCAMDVDEDYW
ncbi:hypothetical protein M0R45_027246 [Rubus argutus]|uniref:Uncharacterized protein n=1 Tax=Rubus argutus TaxID=59490 RepID=A0AAW1X1B2_RUBAR